MSKFLEGLDVISKRKIVFPEGGNDIIKQATEKSRDIIEPILLEEEDSLEKACKMVASGEADTMVAGIDYTSRDVILTAREYIGMKDKTFSASFIMELPDGKIYALADCAACQNPNAEQLAEIILQTAQTYKTVSNDEPRVACLSFSTFGSGGDKNESILKIREAIKIAKEQNPGLKIDGEMQLDAAVNEAIGKKKAPNSEVAGRANVLICPDLNSGNILYKAMEQFAGAHAYGPFLQGFNKPISDLSRGSTLEDVLGVIRISALQSS